MAILAPAVKSGCPQKHVFLASGAETVWGQAVLQALTGFLVPQAHIYSLGATLKAALEYVTEPEPEPRLSQDLEALLSQMQAEDPRDRPDLEVQSHP